MAWVNSLSLSTYSDFDNPHTLHPVIVHVGIKYVGPRKWESQKGKEKSHKLLVQVLYGQYMDHIKLHSL